VELKFRSWEICETAIRKYGWAIAHVPGHSLLEDSYSLAIAWDDLYGLAVAQDGLTLQWVPAQARTIELCETAVRSNPAAMSYVPSQFKADIEKRIPGTTHSWPRELLDHWATGLSALKMDPQQLQDGGEFAHKAPQVALAAEPHA
jgi:hypothetical protein